MSGPEKIISGQSSTFPADLNLLSSIREEWESFLRANQLSEESINDWRLPFTEAVVNAIEHGASSDPSKKITISWQRAGSEVALEITDPGRGPDFESVKNPSLPEDPLSEGGRGIFIIHQFCDKWEHWKNPEGYKQILRKSHLELEQVNTPDHLLDQALNEISLCYESLSAFYRLGESLIRSDHVSKFISQSLSEVATLVQADSFGIAFNDAFLAESLCVDLWASPCAAPLLIKNSKEAIGCLKENHEYVWELKEEVAKDAFLSAFSCGWLKSIQVLDKVIAVVYVAKKDSTTYFNAAQLNTLRTFADLFGISIAQANNAIAREAEQQALKELEIAADLQEKLFPIPELSIDNRWHLFVQRKSARQVGGDYVDALIAPNGDLVLIMVDVMGKGAAAAFLAAMIRTCLRLYINQGQASSDLLSSMNLTLVQELKDLTFFATAALVTFSPTNKELSVVNAGHCPVIISNSNGSLIEIAPSGPPLGLFEDSKYTVEKHVVLEDDKVLLVTDGVYEWPIDKSPWGWDSWLNFIKEEKRLQEPLHMWNSLQRTIKARSDDGEATDDQTFLYCRFNN